MSPISILLGSPPPPNRLRSILDALAAITAKEPMVVTFAEEDDPLVRVK